MDKLREERTQIQAEGIWQSENIDCLYSPNRIRFQDNEKSFIEKEWDNEVKNKPTIFNGKLFHLNRLDFSLSRLVLDMYESSFKEWVGTKSNGFREAFGKNKIIKPLSVGSMMITADKKWVIGRRLRLKTYDFAGQYSVVGGYMDPGKDLLNFKPDPFFAIKREIEEETGIDRKWDIDNVICLGLNCVGQPYLAFNTQLKISYDELISNIPEEKELGKLEAFDYEKQIIHNFVLSNFEELTPHTLANILMSHQILTRLH